ncbi:hypothetical protein G9P44_003214 [Scheffersomyces stipitis]|nr:hypothetical protein G9P44_003214 [Scheffersomyces stipitis]
MENCQKLPKAHSVLASIPLGHTDVPETTSLTQFWLWLGCGALLFPVAALDWFQYFAIASCSRMHTTQKKVETKRGPLWGKNEIIHEVDGRKRAGSLGYGICDRNDSSTDWKTVGPQDTHC